MAKVLNALFDDRYGGPQKRAIDVGSALLTHGVETVLLLPDGDGNAVDKAASTGVECVRVAFHRVPKPKEVLKVLKWLLLLPLDVRRIVKVIRGLKIDLVHVNGSFFLAPALAAKICGRPLIWHLNDTIVPSRSAMVLGWIVSRMANEVVVAASAVAKHYHIRRDFRVIYAPVDVNQIDKKSEYGESGLPMRVGLIGNWNPLKGLDVFVGAATAIYQRMESKVEFVVAGARLDSHADYVASIDRLIHQNGLDEIFRSCGFVDDMPQFLHSLDVLVLSSWSEACPMSVLEAMAAGIPVVATDVGGVREILRSDGEQAGYVVPAGGSMEMAERVLGLLQDQKLRYRMGAFGRKYAEERFSLRACTAAHLDVYRKALERS